MKRPGVGVGVVIKKEGKALFQKRKGAHGAETWCFPGGHMEFGETPEETATREAEEEAGIKIKNPRVVAVTNDHMPEDGKHYLTVFVEAECVGEPEIKEPDKISDMAWADPKTPPEPLFIPVKNFLGNKKLI